MKCYFALILTLVILFKPLWPMVEYALNYDYIVENLCENKDKPMLNCDGKCYLSKMLAEASQGSSPQDNPFEKGTATDKDLKIFQLDTYFSMLILERYSFENFLFIAQPYNTLSLSIVIPPPEFLI